MVIGSYQLRKHSRPWTSRTAAALSGENDFLLDPSPRDLERLRSTPHVKVIEEPGNRVLYIGMDQGRDELHHTNGKGKKPFKDLRVHEALFFARLDRLDTSAYLFGWGGSITDPETTFTLIYRNRGEKGVGEYNRGNFRDDELDALAAASSKQADPEKRKALIRQVFKRHHQQVHHIPLHRQFIPWAARSNVNLVHRADNWLELRWVKVGP